MNSRERVEAALAHREPDRHPVDLGGTVSGIHNEAYTKLVEALGLRLMTRVDPWDVQRLAKLDEEVLEKLGVDFRHISLRAVPGSGRLEPDASGRPCFVDEWGIKWGRNANYYDMIDHPLKDASVDSLERFE